MLAEVHTCEAGASQEWSSRRRVSSRATTREPTKPFERYSMLAWWR